MKQRITFTRTETVTLDFDYCVDPFTRANVEFWINQGFCGRSPLGQPGQPVPTAQDVTPWHLTRSEPPATPGPAEPGIPTGRSKTSSRRR